MVYLGARFGTFTWRRCAVGPKEINARLLKPYVSAVVFVQRGQFVAGGVVCRAIYDYVAGDDRSFISARGLANVDTELPDGVSIPLALSYVTHRPPPWGGLSRRQGDTEDADRQHHLVVVIERSELIAVHSTDDRIKEHLLRKQGKLELGGVGLLTRPALEEALLGGEIATFWMGAGAAGRGRRGPRSKTTYGEKLEETIDQVGDQRHTLSGARGSVGEEILGAGREGVMGVNLERSGFWLARSDNFGQFISVVDRILNRISEVAAAGGGQERFVIFARYVDDLDAVSKAYDASFDVPGEVPGLQASDDEIDAFDWLQNHLATVEASGRRSARLTFSSSNGPVTVLVRPDKVSRGRVDIWMSMVDGDTNAGHEVIRRLERVHPRLYYESGHTVTERGVVAEHFTDVPFGNWVFDPLRGVDISKEKPGSGSRKDVLQYVGSDSDCSLFGWVVRSNSSSWLYCDDGADELCDFVEFDPGAGELTIWHVKACRSGAGRGIAAVPYEDVCAQVTKNTPSLSVVRLVTELEERNDAGDHGPLWEDGRPTRDLSRMIEALQGPRANLRIIVRVLQPHVTKVLLSKARARDGGGLHGERQRLRRLDHLLIATDDAVARMGARLEVVTAEHA